MVKKAAWATMIIVVAIFIITIPLGEWLLFDAPGHKDYSNTFGSAVTMTYDSSTFEGFLENINEILTQVNATWGTNNSTWLGIYSTWWPFDQVKENSLYKNVQYLKQQRKNMYDNINYYNGILNGTIKVLVSPQQWYMDVINRTRNEYKRAGGIDWVIQPAYLMGFRPMAYWNGLIYCISIILGIILIAFIAILTLEF